MDLWTPVLIALLSHQSFDIREAAEQALVDRGPSIQPFLSAGLKHRDAEIARRCWKVWEKNRGYVINWDDVASFPWIDSLPMNWPGRESILNNYLIHRGADNDWIGYRQATWDFLRRIDLPFNEIMDLLKVMREREGYWRMNGHYLEQHPND